MVTKITQWQQRKHNGNKCKNGNKDNLMVTKDNIIVTKVTKVTKDNIIFYFSSIIFLNLNKITIFT